MNANEENIDIQYIEKDASTNRQILQHTQEQLKETQSPIHYPPISIEYVDNVNNDVQSKINQLESQIKNTSIKKVVTEKPYNPTLLQSEEVVPNKKLSERLQKIKQRFKEKENESKKGFFNKSDNAIFQKAKLLENVLNKNQQSEEASNNSSNVDVDEECKNNTTDIINNKPISRQKKKKPTKKNFFISGSE